MNFNEQSTPSLVEPKVKYFIRETLKNVIVIKKLIKIKFLILVYLLHYWNSGIVSFSL